jgi:cytochrome c oxidase subunit 3
MSVIELEPARSGITQRNVDSEVETRCDAPASVAHHFSSAAQQYDAAKLGMWLFLATEVLLFGGLFVLYAVLRYNRPEVFYYGSQFLDARLGAVNTIVLILSSLSMALAVYAAQRGAWRMLVSCLIATVLGGAGFMAVKYVEYTHKIHEGLVLGSGFYEAPDWVVAASASNAMPSSAALAGESSAPGLTEGLSAAATARSPAPTASAAANTAVVAGDATKGRSVWDSTCRTCHGANGEGLPGSGKPIRGSAFVVAQTDAQLLRFLKVGRAPSDPLNTSGSQMPPKGGNPLLKDADLMNVIAFVRTLTDDGSAKAAPQASSPAAASASSTTVATSSDAPSASTSVQAPAPTPPPAPAAEPMWIPKSSIPDAPPGPDGLSGIYTTPASSSWTETIFPHHSVDMARPENAHQFFAIYYLMTGLHGIHVLIGMLVIGGLTVLAMRGKFGPRCYTAIDLGGLYWHLVDLIWIFLFPLFYLL